ncbi:N-glycosylase/DNA lyase [Agrilus planipennis]|uniref:N-glycosylase/DNA lyase n=1 Tax=Agrilus planipennis TaxID=224129 RepID=A0A1W4WYJ9_AGRPL|nr:N-glycosylase/DNA lyase [Agrilus planipennis]XP_018328924.1 N-glycosylase/DNA lyase [Agrilus planipennis]XP_018328925.1 N-glycosylase/DNA lyase [Agrilus planipennis]
MLNNWQKLVCSSKELQLRGTLNGGQSFRWKNVINKNDKEEQWIGVFQNKVWFVKQHEDHLLYKVFGSFENINSQAILKEYFRLDDVNLSHYYEKWSKIDSNFKEAAENFKGIRILKQDVVENIFSFICSQNNHINRISSLVEKLARLFGQKICDIDGTAYYGFPPVEKLADPEVEQILRENGFGYRSKYINKTAQAIIGNGGEEWLDKIKSMNYEDTKRNLMTLTGIGAKVADCICLMSFGHLQALPVDTHVYQIAAKYYLPKLAKQKTITDKLYNEIGDYFRNLYGPLAGWAQTVLFCADLKKFQEIGEKRGAKNKTSVQEAPQIKRKKP